VFLAEEAKEKGLIDDVASFEDAVGAFAADLDKKHPQAGNRGAAGANKPAANGKTNMDLAKLLAALGLPATMSEGDAMAHVGKMKTDLDAANARLATSPKTPDPEVLAERADVQGERIDARIESGAIAVPVADAIKSAMGLPADGKGEAKPVAALLTPVPALGGKTVAAWAVDLFKINAEAGAAPATGEQVEGEQTPSAPAGKVLARKVPGTDAAKRNGGGANGEKLSDERFAELMNGSPLGQETLESQKSAR
jgi:hypothetical protein